MPDPSGLLFPQRPRMEFKGAPQAILLDAVLDRAHRYSSQVTSNPVEDGSSVSDHVVLEPRRLTVHGFITDHPATIGGALSAAAASLFGAGPAVTRSRQGVDALRKAWRERAPMTVVTRLATHENMIVERLEFPEGGGMAESVEFTAELVQVERVKLKVVSVAGDFPAAPTVDAAAGTVNRGRMPTPPAAPASKSLVEATAKLGL